MDEIKAKLNKIADDIVEIKVTLAAQQSDIAHHIKRSDLLEDKMELIETEFKTDLMPIKEHVNQIQGIKNGTMFVLKVSVAVATILTALAKAKGLF